MQSHFVKTNKNHRLTFDYTNHRGEVATRRTACSGRGPVWGATQWHQEAQWFLPMFCLDRKAWRYFALKDMSVVRLLEGSDASETPPILDLFQAEWEAARARALAEKSSHLLANWHLGAADAWFRAMEILRKEGTA
jgi:predicted DNA-binding transcriptional regulator YafY